MHLARRGCVQRAGIRYAAERRQPCARPGRPPDGATTDNFYLDMNGIIHQCSHPSDGGGAASTPLTEREIFVAIGDYVSELMAIIRPRRLLFMAVDGVAPRAKMNQARCSGVDHAPRPCTVADGPCRPATLSATRPALSGSQGGGSGCQ